MNKRIGSAESNKLHNLWFISIDNLAAADEFSTWLSERSKSFDCSSSFQEWLIAHKTFPLSLYIGGVIYRVFSREEAAIWAAGFEAALSLIKSSRQTDNDIF
jgi:hypothetical protein